MNPFLVILYYLFKGLVYVSVRIYHRGVTVVNGHHTRANGPLIVVSNHPATVLDPLHTVVNIGGIVYFLANAGLFKHPITNWLFNRLYCIPIERAKDVEGRPIQNEQNFARAQAHLSSGGKLYIAVEGESYVERRLRRIKTGAARIAISVEAASNFAAGVRILPTGLNYDDPTRFRRPIAVVYGEPIWVADFREQYEKDPQEAVLALSEAIGQHLETLIISTQSEEEETALRRLEALLQTDAPVSFYAQVVRAQAFLVRLRQWAARASQDWQAFREDLSAYFAKLRTLGIGDEALVRRLCPLRLALLVLAMPLAVAGLAMHAPPCYVIAKLEALLNDDVHWRPTYKYLTGLVLYPLFYWIEAEVFTHWFPGKGWYFLVAFAGLGLLAERYIEAARLARQQVRVTCAGAPQRVRIAQAKELRASIAKRIHTLQEG